MNALRPLLFGEVLFDHFPGGEAVLGGAPFNVAWNLQAFGARPLLVTRVGEDETGARVLAAMGDWGMDTAGVQRDPRRPTGRVEVQLEAGQPSYEIAPDQAYDHIAADELPSLPSEVLLCHGSLALRGATTRAALAALCAAGASQRLVDVNLRAPFWEREEVLRLCQGAQTIKLNEHELELLVPEAPSEATRARLLMQRTGARELLLTLGAAGARVISAGSGRALQATPTGTTQVRDCVGAGDAFTAISLLGRVRGWDSESTLQRAVTFSEAIVGLRGATSSDPVFYAPFFDRWPHP